MKWNNCKNNGSMPDQNRNKIGSDQRRNGTGSKFFQKTKYDVKIMTNSIRQSDEPELRRRRKSFLQQCRRYGSDVTERCDDVREEIREPASEYRNRRNDVTERLEQARMLTQNLPNRSAAGRRKNGGLTNRQFAPKLTSMRRQIGGERGRKKTRNLS